MDDWVIMEHVSSTPTLRDNIQKFVYEIIKRKDCYREIIDDYDAIKIHKLLLLFPFQNAFGMGINLIELNVVNNMDIILV